MYCDRIRTNKYADEKKKNFFTIQAYINLNFYK